VTGAVWLRAAGLVLHEDTLARVVEPAVADMQFESDGRPGLGRVRGHVAVARAIAGAVWLDLAWDARQPAWAQELAELTHLALVVAAYQLSMAVLILGFYAPLHKPLAQLVSAGISHGWLVAALIVTFATAACGMAGTTHTTHPTARHDDSTDM
jgi:hypothetical protein